MAKDTTKKRKSLDDGTSQLTKKKSDSNSNASRPHCLEISKLLKPQVTPPVVAVTPGLAITKEAEFHPYDKVDAPTAKKRKKNAPPSEMLLHSSSHRSLDYTAQEDRPNGSRPLVRHFLGVFDPKTGKVEIVESRKMVVRGTVRSQKPSDDAMKPKKTAFEMRTELGQAFGTKKAKKAIRAVTENAITSGGAPGSMGSGDLALMDSIKGTTENMATREQLDAAIEQARPVPRGNYEAEEIQDVYIPAQIIGAEVLKSIPVLDWQEKVKAQEAISVPSRFVANRISRVAHNENALERLRVMRYLLTVLVFWATTRPGRDRGTRAIGRRDQLKSVAGAVPDLVMENIRRKFSDNGVMRKTHIDLLMTHCCVFASIIDNFEVNTLDLREDLKLEQKQIAQYFMEIGARMTQSKKGDKIDHIARLALPLQFPKVRQARQRK
ncbi:RNA polymerase I associated factor, A49-like protein [Immersiella caudata]|uniref:RNA polymerase I associated factor, A49-like protein n=1 Tax=Immersiella caudata TaxID=314043 RepID=A0AA39WWQ8_9PEZI|nr:RNA polymerase I associated factor, A49-like protein [Immersiella caudata]